MRSRDLFTTIRTEGGLLPADLLQRLIQRDKDLPGLDDASYHLIAGERLNERISQSWKHLLGAWSAFRTAADTLPERDAGTTLTRERWLLILLQELECGRLPAARAIEIDGKSYAISHLWHHSPIHLVSYRLDLARRAAGVAGAARTSPHSLVQEFLNRSDDHLWGVVSNGLRLRILRDNISLTRQAFVEFDLEGMMEGEVYADFVLLWLLCHQSRVEAEKPEECWLEKWERAAQEQGTRALDRLRDGVEQAIKALGRGFLAHPANAALRDNLRSGELDKQDYYRQLLRLVYRLLFLFVAEDRDLLYDPTVSSEARERFTNHYSTGRLRRLAARHRGTEHIDLYQGLRIVMEKLGRDDGCPPLALSALGGFLWSEAAIRDLAPCEISNRDFLEAVRALAFTLDNKVLRAVDYKNLGSEELGSIYESLLELHPDLNVDAATFDLTMAGGHERKTTGSSYTPSSLIQCLLDSALDPVLDEAARQPNAEEALLALKVCDPACGSGHFLIAAAHRMARRLAAIRTGDEEPAPEATRTALRDVISHCIYGVDVNPMAVELCKVSLWMESFEPGKPLTFLDHHIQCGNSLLGTTPALLAHGIPDEAFKSIEGDDKAVASALRKRNKVEREGQTTFASIAESAVSYGPLADRVVSLDAIDDSCIAGVHDKEERYNRMAESADYRKARLVADAWCAAFVWKKARDAPEPVTHDVFCRLLTEPEKVPSATRAEIRSLDERYNFFPWHLAFPEVFHVPEDNKETDNEVAGWDGGFDLVIGNPPWDQIELKSREFFTHRVPEIANAQHTAERERLIKNLAIEEPDLYREFKDADRSVEGVQHFAHNTELYPLTNFGRLNTAPLFAELSRRLIAPHGRSGLIIPSGIATDSFSQHFFCDLVTTSTLVSLFAFQSGPGLFGEVGHARFKFCLITLNGVSAQDQHNAEFAFFLRDTDHLRDPERRFRLSHEDLILLNPNTGTCPVFRNRRDADLTKSIYRRVPVLVHKDNSYSNSWGFRGLLMFMMNTASHLFRTYDQLEQDGWVVQGNIFEKNGLYYLPLYEAKMIHQFTHRYGDYTDRPSGSASTALPEVLSTRLDDANYVPIVRYWIPEVEVDKRLEERWPYGWLLCWRDICRTTDERTMIATVIPRNAVGNTLPIFLSESCDPLELVCLLANFNSFCFDFFTRQKVGGIHLTFGYLTQLPVLPASKYKSIVPWGVGKALASWLLPRVLELTYTAWDLEPFAKDCGYCGPPYRWDEERRFLLHCELDAAYFHFYGIFQDDVDYIMETFPIVKRNDIKQHGDYRTKFMILDIYDRMQQAMDTGEPYQTPLDPPPADPRVAHPARTEA